MQCAEFESRFHDLLDARRAVESDRQLLEHSGQCAHCADLLRAQQALFAGLDAFDPPSPNRDFAEQVVLRARTPDRRFSRSAVAIAALAATVLLAAMIVSSGSRNRSANTVNKRPDRLRHNPSVVGGVTPQRTIESPVAPPQVATAPASPEAEEYRELLHNFLEDLPAATERLPNVDHLAGGLRPIASSFTAAIDALRRTIPGARSNSRSDKPQAGVRLEPWSRYSA